MKFLDFTSLFDSEPADLAILSTYQFEADFFERRLLRCPALVKARRILIFMDASQWFNLLRQDVPARFLNRRYLIVPVRPPKGVFHPKLNLLVREDGGLVQCGSNNLTRSGCTSNLELLNSFTITVENENTESIRLAQETFAFFKRACDDADQETGRIARQWLDELLKNTTWLASELPPSQQRAVRLIHTYEGSLWKRLLTLLDTVIPKRFMVISPFFDRDADLAQRILERWPKCKIEFVVQQKTTNLPASALKKMGAGNSLSELRNSSRRLHAKLLAWETADGTGCIVGSANFSTAAFDARNVETCLLIPDAEEYVSALFDGQFTKRPLSFADFDPGTEQEPEPDESKTTLRLTSALLTEDGELKVSYQHRLPTQPSSIRLAIRIPGEQHPRISLKLPNMEKGTASLIPPESTFQDAYGTILASLVAELGDKSEESSPIWVIQEGRLTYEPSGVGSSSTQSKVEDSGEGLTEFLEEIGKRDGASAVIEYLRHLNIRFNDGRSGTHGGRMFRLRIRDPFHADDAPHWLIQAKGDTSSLAETIYDFADRHEWQRLRKHAKRGNINGLENFLDIFTALVRLLYVYYARGIVERSQLVGRFCRYIEVATSGIDATEDFCEGYLSSVQANLKNNKYFREVCEQHQIMGHIHTALLVAQKVRYIPGERGGPWGEAPSRPRDCLMTQRDMIKETAKKYGIGTPSLADIVKILNEYKMFSPSEIQEFEQEGNP